MQKLCAESLTFRAAFLHVKFLLRPWFRRQVRPERMLTAREYEIARLVAQGLSNKHIAHALAISEGTVKIHLHNTFEKLGSVNRTSLAVLMRTAQGSTRTYSS